MKLLKYSFILLLFVGMASCHKDEPAKTTETQTQPGFTPEVIVATTGDVLGYVYDDSGNPVSGATVRMLTESTTTDGYGVFKFRNTELDQQGTYLTVQKGGYILGSDMVYGVEGAKHTVRVQLMALTESGKFANGAGGTVSVDGGGQVVFAANSIENQDGTAYAGDVIVTAKRLASDDPFLSDLMPGSLLAIDEEGSTRTLGTMGMVAVELRSPAGAELNLKPGTTAKVTFPIATNQQEAAPDIIDLWSFDESRGIWKEEGTATKVGNTYEADVSHFSFWNCDAPFPLVSICGKVVFEDGSPASNLQVAILTEIFGVGYGWTNIDGTFGGKVPKNQVLTIRIKNPLCNTGESLIEIEVGPFSNKTILDDIVLDLPSSLSFSGEVLCLDQPLGNATVFYTYGGMTFLTESAADGTISIVLSDDCGDVAELEVIAVDPTTGNASQPIVLQEGDDDFVLQVCNDCGFTVEIAQVSNCETRTLSVEVEGLTDFDAVWSDGSTTQTITLNPNDFGLYCVTITDSNDADCEQISCTDVPFSSELFIEAWVNNSCEEGEINVLVGGGVAPYQIDILRPDGSTFQLDSQDSLLNFTGLVDGQYVVTATDAQNCSASITLTVAATGGIDVDIIVTSDCINTLLFPSFENTTGQYTYNWGSGPTTSQALSVQEDGEYCVTVTDNLGCSGTACITVDVGADVIPEISSISCNGGSYDLIDNAFFDGVITLEWFNYDVTYSLNQGDVVTVDMIAVEFSWPFASAFNDQCEFGDLAVTFPKLVYQSTITEYEIINTSCDSCTDGAIVYLGSLDNYLSYEGAVADEVVILNADYVDVTAISEANELPAGTYFIAITDENTQCYIYSRRVVIE